MYYKLIDNNSHIGFDSFDKAFKKEDETSIKLHSLTPDQIVDLMDMHANGTMNLIVALTVECDLRCSYCFENHLSRRPMSMETCITLLNELEQYITKTKLNETLKMKAFSDRTSIPNVLTYHIDRCLSGQVPQISIH